ncbi:MAG: hypothetical protein KatS3mg084_0591 [Candidatus Dojkabacteria bacterium]|nr:MAG: hypothetical protein KatS3mg084_0591 [Candidatus Dojkabacteria bacterium]
MMNNERASLSRFLKSSSTRLRSARPIKSRRTADFLSMSHNQGSLFIRRRVALERRSLLSRIKSIFSTSNRTLPQRRTFSGTISSSKSNSSHDSFKLHGKKRLFFYLSAIFGVPILLIIIAVYVFIDNSVLYAVTLRYKYQNLLLERQIQIQEDSPLNLKIMKLTTEDGVTVSNSTTGQKIVGEKASGYISVFNSTAEIKVISKGTEVLCISPSCNGLVYIANSDLNLGPGSSSGDLQIVASDIGENYNVNVNAGRFKVGNFDPNLEIIAANVRPITGGTPKKTVNIVSADDIKALEEKALNYLKGTILLKLTTDPNHVNKYLFSENSLKIEKISVQGDQEGQEADVVNLTVRAKGTIDAIPKDSINNIVEEMKASMVPDGYYLDEKTFKHNLSVASTDNDFIITITATGIGRVNLNIDELKSKLANQSLHEAEKIIISIPNIHGVSISYVPDYIPEFFRKVPSNPNKIQIRLIAEDPES